MPRCKLCNKKGIFFKVNKDGFCEDCVKLREENAKKAEENRLKRIENEENKLKEIPKYEIVISNQKRNRQTGFEPPKMSNITPKGKYNAFVVFDTETTGLTPSKDRIIELAAVKVRDGVAIASFHTYVNPERSIPIEATNINHITNEMVENAPRIAEVLESFETFVGSDTLIAHNLEFDLKFLYYSGTHLLDTKRKYIDTVTQAKKAFKKNELGVNSIWSGEVANYKLENLCKFLDITMVNEHSALSDAFATARLFMTLVDLKQNNR